jgi:flotillin
MDTRPRTIEGRVENAYSEGGKPLTVTFSALIRIAPAEPQITNAIERFLGRELAEVDRVARETVEGHLRGVIASLTPDELRSDRVKVAQLLLEELDTDLDKLGLQVDELNLGSISLS